MTHTKLLVLTMSDNIWRILKTTEVPVKSITLNHERDQYNWMLADVPEGTSNEEVAIAPQITRPKMPNKLDRPVMLIPTILMARPIPQPPR